jgi:steroid delta-isomerase-like uncharacterized protein
MTTEGNKMIARRIFEDLLNKRNVPAVTELFAASAVFHYPLIPEPLRGTEALTQFFSGVHRAFPDIHFVVNDVFAEGDKVAVRWTVRGTFKGEYAGIAPTGKQGTVSGVDLFALVDGKVTENWVNYNTLGFMQQLGVIPSA